MPGWWKGAGREDDPTRRGAQPGGSLPGLFAAGDVTNVMEKQIIIAAGEGAKAALSAYAWLVERGWAGG